MQTPEDQSRPQQTQADLNKHQQTAGLYYYSADLNRSQQSPAEHNRPQQTSTDRYSPFL